jgi:hypothetical protein
MLQLENLMKKFIPLLLGAALPLFGQSASHLPSATDDLPPVISLEPPSPKGVSAISNLIRQTESNLATQRQLMTLLKEYLQIEERYIKNPGDKALVAQLVHRADALLEIVNSQKLTHLIDEDLLSELSLFSRIASKQSPAL